MNWYQQIKIAMKLEELDQQVEEGEFEVPWSEVNRNQEHNIGKPIHVINESSGICQRSRTKMNRLLIERNLPISSSNYTSITALSPTSYSSKKDEYIRIYFDNIIILLSVCFTNQIFEFKIINISFCTRQFLTLKVQL